MKFRVHMKDTGTLYDSIADAVSRSVADLPLSQREREAVEERRREDFDIIASIWFEYGECITLEIDTDTKTCRAIPKAELS